VNTPSIKTSATHLSKRLRYNRTQTMSFAQNIEKFNAMYGLPHGAVPNQTDVGDPVNRMIQFGKIMRDEVDENLDIIKAMNGQTSEEIEKLRAILPADTTQEELAMVMLMDWLGDIQVYAASEARRFGIPFENVLQIIMASNFSKLDVDGKAIIKDGKVQKGPGYWKPEPMLLDLLRELRKDQAQATTQTGIVG
jgi:hypothetical protein